MDKLFMELLRLANHFFRAILITTTTVVVTLESTPDIAVSPFFYILFFTFPIWGLTSRLRSTYCHTCLPTSNTTLVLVIFYVKRIRRPSHIKKPLRFIRTRLILLIVIFSNNLSFQRFQSLVLFRQCAFTQYSIRMQWACYQRPCIFFVFFLILSNII